jgi:hypothetical protein
MTVNKRDYLVMVFLTAMILIFGSYAQTLSVNNDSPYLYIIEAEVDPKYCENCLYDYLPGEYVLSKDSIEQVKKIENVQEVYLQDYFPKNFFNDGTFIESDWIVTLNEPIIYDDLIPIKKTIDLYTFMSVDFTREFYDKNGNVDLSYYSYQYESSSETTNPNNLVEITISQIFAKQFNVAPGDSIDLNVIKTANNQRVDTKEKYFVRAIFDSTYAPPELQNKIFINKVNTDSIYDIQIFTDLYKQRYLAVSNGEIKSSAEHDAYLKDFKSFVTTNNSDVIKAYIVTSGQQDITHELRAIFPTNKISNNSKLQIFDIYYLILLICITLFIIAIFIVKSIEPFTVILSAFAIYIITMFIQYIYVGYTFKINLILCCTLFTIIYLLSIIKKWRN